MAGKPKRQGGFGKKLNEQQKDNKTLYSISGGVPSQASNSIISGGSQGGGTAVNVMDHDIYMNTYDIVDVDRLKFAAKEGAGDALTADDYGMEAIFTGGNAYGLQIRYPAGASQIFQLSKGADALINISDAFGMLLSTDLVLDDSTLTIGNVSSPSSPSATFRKIFVDEDNSDHLTVKKSDGTEIDLEAGGSWVGTATSDLDMDTWDIINIDRLQFASDSGAGRDNTKVEMYANANNDAVINFPDAKDFLWTQNGQYFLTLDEDGIVPRLDNNWSIGTGSYRLASLNTKLASAQQQTITEYLTMSNTGAGGDHYAYVVGQMTSSGNAGASLGSSTVYLDDYNHYWLRTSTRILDLQSGQSVTPTHSGEFRLDGTDVKVYTGGGVKNLSDIGTGGSSGADTALSNLTLYGEVHFDSRYGVKGSTNTWSAINTFSNTITLNHDVNLGSGTSDDINLNGTLDILTNTGSSGASSAGTYNGNILSPDGYITIKISGTDKTIPYYST